MLGGFHRLELTSFDEVVEELRMRLETAVLDALHQLLELAALRHRQQRHARALDGCVADLYDLAVGDVGDQADSLRRVDLQVATEASREIEDVDVVEGETVFIEHDLKSRDVRALGLREL